jgi:DNA-directed RNA polymerase I subunit RPA2
MTKKLFALANNKCALEGVDAVMMQECLLGGHLYLQVIKEKLYSWLMLLKTNIVRRAKNIGNNFTLNTRT